MGVVADSPRDIAIGFLSSGRVDPSFGTAGRTFFPSGGPGGTWAVPGSDGSTFVITEQVPAGAPNGQPEALSVRGLSLTGHIEKVVGQSGATRTIDISWAATPSSEPMVAAMPGSRGSAIIVVAGNREARIYRVEP